MSKTGGHIDKPEPRWQALLALIAVGGIYLALPRSLVVGPAWLLPTGGRHLLRDLNKKGKQLSTISSGMAVTI